MNTQGKRWIPLAIGMVAFAYYALLSSKAYTWMFTSGDSGDWLASSNWWIVPQPLGSPLYISLGHWLALFPGDLVIKMTLVLSALPSAITVLLVYLIVKHLTQKEWASITSATALLGAGLFLSQATVLEEYALAVMFVVLGFYFYLRDKKWLVALSLGLGSAVHILVMPIAVLWLFLHLKSIKPWLKVTPVYIVSGILPYGLILYLMTIDTPRLLAGGLSWGALDSYLGSTTVVGSLSIMEAPQRLLEMGVVLLAGFGLAFVPIGRAIKDPWDTRIKMLIVMIGFSIWYYLTCLDPTTWTFMLYACPALAIMAGIGLNKMKSYHTNVVLAGVVLLVGVNGFMLNANKLAHEEPKAIYCYNAIQALPNQSAVVIHRGGFEAMSLFYAMSEGKDIIPIFYTDWRWEEDDLYWYYKEWIEKDYGIGGVNTQEMVLDTMEKGISVYILYPVMEKWETTFETETIGNPKFELVIGVNPYIDVHKDDREKWSK